MSDRPPFPPRARLEAHLRALGPRSIAGFPSEPAECVLSRWLRREGFPAVRVGNAVWWPTGYQGERFPLPKWAAAAGDAWQEAQWRAGSRLTGRQALAVLAEVPAEEGELAYAA